MHFAAEYGEEVGFRFQVSGLRALGSRLSALGSRLSALGERLTPTVWEFLSLRISVCMAEKNVPAYGWITSQHNAPQSRRNLVRGFWHSLYGRMDLEFRGPLAGGISP